MKKLYIKQKVFSWKDEFRVKDEQERDIYKVEGKLFSWAKKLSLCDMNGKELIYIEQKLMNWLPTYNVYQEGKEIATVRKELSFIKPKYRIEQLDWYVEGSFTAHDYEIVSGSQAVATIRKEWFSFSDYYELAVMDEKNELPALAIMIIIDCVMASESAAASSGN
ncbi:LURP-one-related/scramblase family protein [Lacticigenium naphthae]|uniref:LURP-one-related/scramblase family protein n=1 Tax=Lacticigenium naphthae TaxID=515351 RepID=UPI0004111FD7|nr:LURP-one-related family protein [Lacticigenium naphthae]